VERAKISEWERGGERVKLSVEELERVGVGCTGPMVRRRAWRERSGSAESKSIAVGLC
jgi:hypothetical protein